MDETWKSISGFEGLYEVSNLGRVKSLNRSVRANTCGVRLLKEKILSLCTSSCGYYIVVLCRAGKHYTKLVHRLVAEAFLPNPLNFREVNHKDEDKSNNRLENLEWCDREYNANYGTGVDRCARKRWKPVAMCDKDTRSLIKVFESAREASKETKINYKRISAACHGRIHTAGGFYWAFK